MKKISIFFSIILTLILIYFIIIYNLINNFNERENLNNIEKKYNLVIEKDSIKTFKIFPIIKINSKIDLIKKNNINAKNIIIKISQPHFFSTGNLNLNFDELVTNSFILKNVKINGRINYIINYFQKNSNLNNLINGKYKITGDFILKTTSEERILISFLKLLFEKLENKNNNKFAISKLLDAFGNFESTISGSISKKNNILQTEDITINNRENSILLKGEYNFKNDELILEIDLKQNGLIYLSGIIKGTINSPKINFDNNSELFKNYNKNENNIIEDNIINFLNNFLDD